MLKKTFLIIIILFSIGQINSAIINSTGINLSADISYNSLSSEEQISIGIQFEPSISYNNVPDNTTISTGIQLLHSLLTNHINYISPTPADGSTYENADPEFTISIANPFQFNITNANVTINSISYPMVQQLDLTFDYTYSGNYSTHTYQVFYPGGNLSQRTVTLQYPTSELPGFLRIFPYQGFFAQMLTLSLLLGYFIFN